MMNMRLVSILSVIIVGMTTVVDATTVTDIRRVMMDNNIVHQKCNGLDWKTIDEYLLKSELKMDCSATELEFISSELDRGVRTGTITSLCGDKLKETLPIMCKGR